MFHTGLVCNLAFLRHEDIHVGGCGFGFEDCDCQLNQRVRWEGLVTSLHILQRLAGRLLDQEEGVDRQGVVEDAEHEKGAPSDVIKRRGRDACEDKIEQPLRCRTDGISHFSKPSGPDFSLI